MDDGWYQKLTVVIWNRTPVKLSSHVNDFGWISSLVEVHRPLAFNIKELCSLSSFQIYKITNQNYLPTDFNPSRSHVNSAQYCLLIDRLYSRDYIIHYLWRVHKLAWIPTTRLLWWVNLSICHRLFIWAKHCRHRQFCIWWVEHGCIDQKTGRVVKAWKFPPISYGAFNCLMLEMDQG